MGNTSSSHLKFKMLSGILIFNQKGENLIFRAFRNDGRPRLADVFRIQVISNAQVRSPILTLGSTTFSHVKHENIYLVAITKSNANAALVFEFLYRLIALGKGYFGKFDEEAVKNNFVLVYELLDEILDYRYPEDVHYHRRSQVREDDGGLGQDHHASNRRAIMAKGRCQIPQERSIRRCDRGRQPSHVCHRNGPPRRCQRTNRYARIPYGNTRMQIRTQ